MKLTRTLASAVLATVILSAAYGTTQAQSGGTYATGLQVVNMEASTANVTLTLYDAAGNPTEYVTTTLGNEAMTFNPLPLVESGFSGSAVVSSDKQIAAVLNMNRTPAGRAAYVGVAEGSTDVLIPLLLKNHGSSNSTTFFKVQNAGTADAVVTVTYTHGDGSTSTATATVVPGAAATFDQATESHATTSFSGKVSSNEPVVVTVVQENATQVFAYGAFPSGTTNPVMPLVNVQPAKDYETGIQIQNGGSAETTVTVTYYPSLDKNGNPVGTQCTEEKTIPAGQSRNFAKQAFSGTSLVVGSTCTQGARFVGAAKVTGNSTSQPLVAIVNQNMPDGGAAYSAFNADNASNQVVFPLVKNKFGATRAVTGFNVMNVGTSTTTVTCVVRGKANGIDQEDSVVGELDPGEALQALMSDPARITLSEKFKGAATCTAVGGDAKIVGVVNETASSDAESPSANQLDKLFTSEGVNAVAAPTL